MKKIWAGLSLVQKSITVGCMLLIANSFTLFILHTNIEEREHLSALEDEGVSVARAVAETNKYGVITRNRDILAGSVQGMLTKNVSSITVLDSDGNLLAEAVGNRGIVPKRVEPIMSELDKERIYGDDGSLDLIIVRFPIEVAKRMQREEIGFSTGGMEMVKERVGTAIVVMNAREVYREIARDRRTFAFFSLIIISVGVPVIIFFVEITAKPLKRLVTATQKVADGDLGYKVEVTARDEIGDLARSFNAMTEKLKESRDKVIMTERLAAAGRLAADVAHEINNPLAIMKNYIYIISNKKMREDDPNQQPLKIIDGEIDRVARIIRSFNDFYYKGTQAISLEPVDLLEPLREVTGFCMEGMKARGITIEERLTGNGKIMANRDMMKQIFLNLIKNAEEAMPEGGTITVETRKEDRGISVSVTDTGIGIKNEHINRIFDPFFSTKGIKGTGLGLSVTYGIIKNLNGDIEVESEEGKGTTFRITLPTVS